MRCAECGKVIVGQPRTVTISLSNPTGNYNGLVEAFVCDDDCGRRYMFRIKNLVIVPGIKMWEGA